MTANLCGEYQFSNNTLEGGGYILQIRSRIKPTHTKPKYFLLQLLGSGSKEYVSSLFPAKDEAANGLETYFLDWQGVRYILHLDRDLGAATIGLNPAKARPPRNSTNPINNVELGSKSDPNLPQNPVSGSPAAGGSVTPQPPKVW